MHVVHGLNHVVELLSDVSTHNFEILRVCWCSISWLLINYGFLHLISMRLWIKDLSRGIASVPSVIFADHMVGLEWGFCHKIIVVDLFADPLPTIIILNIWWLHLLFHSRLLLFCLSDFAMDFIYLGLVRNDNLSYEVIIISPRGLELIVATKFICLNWWSYIFIVWLVNLRQNWFLDHLLW